MKKVFRSKKRAVGLGVVAVLLGAVGAFAYFTTTGSGTGSAKTGSATNVSISQIGAGYDSLVAGSGDPYVQDQCFGCEGISELGNDVTLSTPAAAQLVDVVVAFRNWGGAISGLPITVTIYNTVAGPISDTTDASFDAALGPNTPSVANVTFDFSAQGAVVDQTMVYGITFDPTKDNAGGLNVALSSSATDLSVGADAYPGTIWLSSTLGITGGGGDFPACTPAIPANTWEQVATNCGSWAIGNPGAYGNEPGTSDVPAVEINVVGGTVTALYPGAAAQPLEFAITNPNPGPVSVNQALASVQSSGGDILTVPGDSGSAVTGCLSTWYQINGSPDTLGATLQPGVTLFTTTSSPASALSIQMLESGTNQNVCEGQSLALTFSSN
jgi:hypothetical protein